MAINLHTHEVQRVFRITLVLNLAVAFGKIILGLTTGALAITADGFHSLTDSAGNIAGLLAVRVSGNPPDRDHPYGHGRYETIGALVIGMLLLVTAWEVFTGMLDRLGGAAPYFSSVTVGVLVLTLIVNVAVSRYQMREGTRLNSLLLRADASNTSTDVYVTLAVLTSSLLVAITGWAWLDAATALIVISMIVRTGWHIVRDTGRVLVDTAPYSAEEITPLIENVAQVQSVSRVRTRGSVEAAFIDVDVCVAPLTTVLQTECITNAIRATLENHFVGIEEVEVHFAASQGIRLSLSPSL